MKKISRVLQENGILLVCMAVLAYVSLLAWQSLSKTTYIQQRPVYAVREGALAYKDIIGFRPENFDWKEYDYPAPPPDTPSPDAACATFGVFAPLVGIIGTMQAAEALKIIIGLPGEHGVLRCYNALSGAWQAFKIQKNSGCLVCGEAA